MDAVIAARLSLDTTRLSYTEEPSVVLAEELRFEDARKRVAKPDFLQVINTDEIPENTKVWLVLFEANWQSTGPLPEHPITPEPPLHGCVYIILLDPNDLMRTQIGTTECSP